MHGSKVGRWGERSSEGLGGRRRGKCDQWSDYGRQRNGSLQSSVWPTETLIRAEDLRKAYRALRKKLC